MAIGLVYNYFKKKDTAAVTGPLKAIDFETIGLLFGLFLVIGGITHMGVVDAAANLLAHMGGGQRLCDLHRHRVGFGAVLGLHRQHPLCCHHAAGGHQPGGGPGHRPHIAVFRPAVRRYSGRATAPPSARRPTSPASASCAAPGMRSRPATSAASASPFTLAAIIPAYIYFWVLFA